MPASLREFFWIFVAGGLGASLRVALATTLDRWLQAHLPYVGTLVVNLIGCLGIGLASVLIGPGALRPIILGGFLGGFTTYSAFGLLSWQLLHDGRTLSFAAQVGIHLVAGLLCVWAGIALGRVIGPPERLP